MPTTVVPMSTPKLTIGFPVFDDHQGLLFTIEALRMYQDLAGCEVLIVDNNPNGPDGKDNKGLVASMNSPDTPFRYVAAGDNIGPSVTKGRVFTEAAGEWVLCLDAHELLPFGTIPRLLKWFDSNPECRDLLTGPLLSNQLFPIATHFSNKWSGEMWGTWALAWACTCGEMFECRELKIEGRATPAPPVCSFYNMIRQEQDVVCRRCGKPYPAIPWSNHEPRMAENGYKPVGFDPNTPPFEIPAMGMGLFACRRDAWLGFAKGVYGFGAEEWCIHERYRQAGHKTLCLPFLRWWHRFARKAAPYPALRHHKVRNYVLEFRELGLDPTPIYQHFVTDLKVYQQAEWDRLIKDPMGARDPVAAPCTTCGGGAPAAALVNGQLQQPPGEAQDIEAIYEWAIKTPRDLDQHLPKLRELAAGCEHVTEITKRRESTIGLLAGRPKTMISWQQEQDPLNGRVHAAVAATIDDNKRTAFTSHVGQHGGVPAIEETDGLFIDDIHHGDRAMAQLTNLAPQVRHWIAWHDTQSYGEKGDGGGPGLLTAIRAYLRQHPEWSVVYHSPKQYGFTVISRNPADKPSLPSVTRMAWNYTKAIAAHVATGAKAASEELFNARLDVCALCEQRVDNRCSVCGCYLDESPAGTSGKAIWAESECPLGRWPMTPEMQAAINKATAGAIVAQTAAQILPPETFAGMVPAASRATPPNPAVFEQLGGQQP